MSPSKASEDGFDVLYPEQCASSETSGAAPSSPTRPRPQRRRSSAISLQFCDVGSCFGDPNANTVTIPTEACGILDSARNGAVKDELLNHVKAPGMASQALANAVHGRVRSFDWLHEIAEDTSMTVAAAVNRAFEGKDAVEMYHAVADCVPTIRLPSRRMMAQTVDTVLDRLQDLRMQPATELPSDPEPQTSQWLFAGLLGQRAKAALVRQNICKQYHLLAADRAPAWQLEMTQALVSLLKSPLMCPRVNCNKANTYMRLCEKHKFVELLGMKPVWVSVRDKEVWQLVLDTGMTEIVEIGKEVGEVPVQLDTRFSLPEQEGWTSLKDYDREMLSVEGGEWEAVEA